MICLRTFLTDDFNESRLMLIFIYGSGMHAL